VAVHDGSNHAIIPAIPVITIQLFIMIHLLMARGRPTWALAQPPPHPF
jgi:hypothetical protein